jgi:hypothetical protein
MTKCTRRAIPVAVVEQLVVDCYARISINADEAKTTATTGFRSYYDQTLLSCHASCNGGFRAC